MKITILATGTRGDVQSCIALGAGLQSSDHQACIAASKDFAELIRQVGLAYYPIDVDVKAILNGAEGQDLMKKEANWVLVPVLFLRKNLLLKGSPTLFKQHPKTRRSAIVPMN